MILGFSTGCLYEKKLSLLEKLKIYNSLGCNAVEINFFNSERLLGFELNKELIKEIKNFNYVSLHSPWIKEGYGNNDITNKAIEKLKIICRKITINGIIIHPNIVNDFYFLEKTKLPFLIENMDLKKEVGKTPKYFEKIKKNYNFNFILDLQHSYENDKTMNLTYDLINVMGDKLKQLHVSGCTNIKNHFPVHLSKNKDKIKKTLRTIKNIPCILEGALFDENINKTLSNELKFIKND